MRLWGPIAAGIGMVLGGILLFARKARASTADVPLLVEVPPRPPTHQFIRPDLVPQAEAAARKYGLPVEGFVRQIWVESRFNPEAYNAGSQATGIAQFTPATAESYNLDPRDPVASLDASARMMKALHRQFGSWGLATAAYNWGSGNVQKWQRGERTPPKETRDYMVELAPAYGEPVPALA